MKAIYNFFFKKKPIPFEDINRIVDIESTTFNKNTILSYKTKINLIFILCMYFPIAGVVQFVSVTEVNSLRIIGIIWSGFWALAYLIQFWLTRKIFVDYSYSNQAKYKLRFYLIVQISVISVVSTGMRELLSLGPIVYFLGLLVYALLVFMGIYLIIEYKLIGEIKKIDSFNNISGKKKLGKILVKFISLFFGLLIVGIYFFRINKWWILNLDDSFVTENSIVLKFIGFLSIVSLTLLPTLLFDARSLITYYYINKYSEEFRKINCFSEEEWYGN